MIRNRDEGCGVKSLVIMRNINSSKAAPSLLPGPSYDHDSITLQVYFIQSSSPWNRTSWVTVDGGEDQID